MKKKDGWWMDLPIAQAHLADAYKKYGKDNYLAHVIMGNPTRNKPIPHDLVGNEYLISTWLFFRPLNEMASSIKARRKGNREYEDMLPGVESRSNKIAEETKADLRKFDLSYNATGVMVVNDPSKIGLVNNKLHISRARKLMLDQLKGGGKDDEKFVVDIRNRERRDEFVTAEAIWLERKRSTSERKYTLAERRGHIAWVHDEPKLTYAYSPASREIAARNSRNRLLRAIDSKLKGEG